MPTCAPAPAAIMRRGKLGSAPGSMTRTGCIALTFAPGESRIATKSIFIAMYDCNTGSMPAGTA